MRLELSVLEYVYMKKNLIQKTEQFVINSFEGNQNDIRHAQKTVFWIKQLKPEADDAFVIAGLLHDIERAVYGDWKCGSEDEEKLEKHQKQSAQVAEDFLLKENADKKLIERVKILIFKHETGGNEDQNILSDADNIAWFEDKAPRHAREYKDYNKTKEQIQRKFDSYLTGMKTEKGKKFAQKYYDDAVKILNKNKNENGILT